MRLVVLLVLAGLLLAGCTAVPQPPAANAPILGDLVVPEGAAQQLLAEGSALVWKAVKLPFADSFTLPANATMVRLVADPGPTGAVNVGMVNAETGRRRCNNPTVTDFAHTIRGPKTCSNLAAIDPPGAKWRFGVSGTGKADVRVEFLTSPIDGLAGQLDLSQLSMPVHTLKPTTTQFVPSFDGTKLRVEVTLPEGPGPWPTIIESSPYHDDGLRQQPASFAYFVKDWASRGYAIVVADVRGFGDSGGCVEVWGPNEQKDQAFLVEWAAQQPWSDGAIGFYGQSYVGTTPVEAAVQAPEHLKAIITVAPVIKNYNDWHFGGVPNGEGLLSPVAYTVLTDATVASAQEGEPPAMRDPLQMANNLGNGVCDPVDLVRPNDPRALNDAYYQERDFGARAHNIKAAVLYTHGFEDANVKGQMIPDWFNAIPSPKLGLFGHWLHQHPPRMDQEVLFLGWMDQYLKGRNLGFSALPNASISVDAKTERLTDTWPTSGTTDVGYYFSHDDGPMTVEPAAGATEIHLDSSGEGAAVANLAGLPVLARASVPVTAPLAYSGVGTVHVRGELKGASNGYLAAYLWDAKPDDRDPVLVTWGQVNLAHNADHTQYTPLRPGDIAVTDLPLRPTEHIVPAGHFLVLELRGVVASDALSAGGAGGATFTFHGGADGTRLHLPTLPLSEFQPIALTATP